MFTKATILQTHFNLEYEKAGPEERKLIDSHEGRVQVIAAPGTRIAGILALRTGKILTATETLPGSILCLTSTEASAHALKKRVEAVVGPDGSQVNIYTLPAFCEKVLQDNAILFKNNPLKHITPLETIRVIKKLITAFSKNHPLKRYRSDVYHEMNNLKRLFSIMKRGGWTAEFLNQKIDLFLDVLPAENETNPATKIKVMMEKLRAGVNEFDQYQRQLELNNRYDVDDLVYLVIKAFEQDKHLLNSYRRKSKFIQVDDQNVISHAGNQLLQLLIVGNENPNVLLINFDEKIMSIPRTGGKTGHSLANMYADHFRTIMINPQYNTSYRQGGNKNEEQCSKQAADPAPGMLYPGTPGNTVITIYHSEYAEMTGITNRVYELFQQNTDLGKIAVIYGGDEYSAALEQYFLLKNIPFYSTRNSPVTRHPFINKIIQLLRYINMEHTVPFSGDHLLFEILHFDFYRIPAFEIARLAVEVSNKKRSVTPTAIRKLLLERAHAPAKDLFDTGMNKELKNISAVLEKLIADTSTISLWQLFENIIHDARVLPYMDQSPDSILLTRLLTVFREFVKNETTRNPGLQLNELVETIDIMEKENLPLQMNNFPFNPGGIHIIKAAEAKEREFDYIFIAGANASPAEKDDWLNGIYQLPGIIFDDESNRALRHLFYAALAGNLSNLFISFSKYDKRGKEQAPSSFVTEILSHHTLAVNHVEWTDDQPKEYEILNKTKLLPEIEQPGETLITPVIHKFIMNVSALNNYLNCPLGFYYKNILRIPDGKSEAMEFGSAVHYALEKLFKKMSAGHLFPAPAAKDDQFSPAAELVEDFKWYMQRRRTHFTGEAFDRRMKYGEKVLLNYYAQYVNSWNKVVSVERNFRGITINGVPLKGKLDKLEFNGKEVSIVDYKSGEVEKALPKMKPPNDDDPNGGDYWRQAVFYMMLVDNYDKKDWQVVNTEFDFIEPDKNNQYHKQKIPVNPPDIETVKQQLTEVWAKIQAREFYTGCGKPGCHWCNFVKDNKLAVALHIKQV